MSDPSQGGPDEGEEVGEEGTSLRYWLAKEAIRHAEARLTAQASSLVALESRATSILGWAVAGVFALGTASTTGHYRAAAGAAAFVLFLAAIFCIIALWPRDWAVAGYNPAQIYDSGYGSELEVLEYAAQGYETAVVHNDQRLRSFGRCLVGSWLAFISSPVVALSLAYLALVIS